MEATGAEPSTLFTVGLASAVVISLGVALLLYNRRPSNAEIKAGSGSGALGAKQQLALASQPSLEADPARPRARVLYGTQTGTAERFSKQLAGELRKRYGESMTIDVVDLENYHPEQQLAKEKLVVMCVATYGDGEPTDNAADFFAWLAKEVAAVEAGEKPAPLQGMSYAVFGLGNKQYEHFNAMGKKAYASLGVLGATPVVRRGDGDDDGCIDDDFDKWAAELYETLDSHSALVGAVERKLSNGSVNGLHHEGETVAQLPTYHVEEVAAGTPEDPAFPAGGSGKDHHSPYWATVSHVRELHTAHSNRSCVHVEIDISGASASYEAGDHVAIHAANSPEVVEEVAGLLGYQLEQRVRLSLPASDAADLAAPPAGVLSVRALLSYHADLLSTPHKDALGALARCATDPAHAARLTLLASAQGKQQYSDWVAKQHRSLLEVLREFPSVRPPLGVFLAGVAPRLQPRFYSISSSPALHPSAVHVTCAVVRDVMPTGRIHEGVASTHLKRHAVGGKVPVFLRSSHFKLPRDPSLPVVMVGPGTGLAPFRGFLQERASLRERLGAGALGPCVLFFGCRSQAADYIYREELAAHLQAGELSALHVAFSRDGPVKDYVQHHMERQGAELWQLLGEQGGSLYVCGDAKHMAKDVHRTLVSIVSTARGCSAGQAEAWVKELQDSGRYHRDVW